MATLSPTVGGGVPDTYTVSQALPAGVTIGGSSGVISGTPSAVTPLATYTVTASNTAGSTSFDLALQVVAPVVPVVQFASPNSAALESSASAGVVVVLSAPTVFPVTVDFTVAGGATDGLDYTAPTPPLVIPAGAVAGTIDVPLLDDAVSEGPETVVITLQSAVNGTLGSPQTHTLTIQDDEGTPTVAFTTAAVAYGEGSGAHAIDFALNPTSSQVVSVSISVAGSATGGGSDYLLGGTSVTFLPGEGTKQITLTIIDDPNFEGDELIVLSLTNPIGAALGSPDQLTITITDDELEPVAEFPVTNVSIPEGSGAIPLTVAISDLSATDVTITYQVTGSATDPDDYSIDAPPLVITAGSLSGTIILTPVDDGVAEPTESIIVTLTGATGASLGLSDTLTVSLTDALAGPCFLEYSDAAAIYGPGVTITPNIPSVGCGGATVYGLSATSPALPLGLSLSSITGVITGTPTVEQSAISYQIVASNPSGSTSTTITIQISPVFTLSGSAPIVPYDPVLGTANFGLSILIEEEPSGTPIGFHGIEGISCGLRVESTQLMVLSALEGADSIALNGGMAADFFVTNIIPEGITVGVIVSFPSTDTIMATTPREIVALQIDTVPAFLQGNMAGEVVELPFDGTIGSPPIINLIVHSIGLSVLPRTAPIVITFVP